MQFSLAPGASVAFGQVIVDKPVRLVSVIPTADSVVLPVLVTAYV